MAIAFLLPVMVALVLSAFRATRIEKNVMIIADGKARQVAVHANFVSEALREAGFTCGAEDVVLPPAMAMVQNGDVITVRRVSRRILQRETLIPHATQVLPNNRMRVGSEVELRAGMPGLKREAVEAVSIDGRTREETLSSQVILEPVSRKIYRGTRVTGKTIARKPMIATAYTAGPESCWPSVDGKTAVMQRAGYGVAAVDPRVVPLGTRLYIPGYGFAVATDVGGAIRGARIDLFMADVATARAFGKRPVEVYLLD